NAASPSPAVGRTRTCRQHRHHALARKPVHFRATTMTHVRLVDVSLRDGNQSLWGMTGVTTRTVERMSPLLERGGYRALEAMSSTQMAVAVRYHREDPWARLDAGVRGAPHTPWAFLTTGRRFITFYRTPLNLLELAFTLL